LIKCGCIDISSPLYFNFILNKLNERVRRFRRLKLIAQEDLSFRGTGCSMNPAKKESKAIPVTGLGSL
jgi:hypothetical protein